MGVSFRSLLGEGFTCSLAALTSRTPSQGGPMAPRLSGSSSSCNCCSDLARCIWSSRSCTRSSMMASRSSWTAWFRWLFFIFKERQKGQSPLKQGQKNRESGQSTSCKPSHTRIYFYFSQPGWCNRRHKHEYANDQINTALNGGEYKLCLKLQRSKHIQKTRCQQKQFQEVFYCLNGLFFFFLTLFSEQTSRRVQR